MQKVVIQLSKRRYIGNCIVKKVIELITEAEKRRHRCCFTGHRPEKLQRTEQEIWIDLEREIHIAIHDGLNVFITGMARGVDYGK